MAERDTEARLDAALVARALQSGDKAAFGQLIRRHQGMVRAQLRRLTAGDHSWADDLAQETFMLAWRKLDQFRGQAQFATWLYRIAYTTFLQARRGRKAQFVPVTDNERPSDDHSGRIALQRDLAAALRSLPQAQSAAITLCYDFDLSHEDAAYVLGIPLGTVKTNIARGKARLRELLTAWCEDSRQT